jgi:hypothetical protein
MNRKAPPCPSTLFTTPPPPPPSHPQPCLSPATAPCPHRLSCRCQGSTHIRSMALHGGQGDHERGYDLQLSFVASQFRFIASEISFTAVCSVFRDPIHIGRGRTNVFSFATASLTSVPACITGARQCGHTGRLRWKKVSAQSRQRAACPHSKRT